MFEKYLLLGIFQLALFLFALPVIVGFFAGLIWRERAGRRLWSITIGLMIAVNVAVLIDKQSLFFTAQVAAAFLPFEPTIVLKTAIGAVGDTLLALAFYRSIGRGYRSGFGFITRGHQSQPKKS